MAIAAALLMTYSCASIGNPSGGPRDEDPPRVVRTYPAEGSTGVKGSRIYLEFDELVNVKDAFSNVVVSPPQARMPKVSASGKRVTVEWDEEMMPGTTYTIDFGNSIEDVNESNKLGNYSLSFSTGDDIDTLRISGMVLDAATLEPQQGMLVGVHPAEAPDSALRTLRFCRATKTDDRGRFTIRGLKAMPYNLFALGDLNNDYRWDNPAELLAFYPNPITPYAQKGLASDTVYDMLSGAVDTVKSRERTVFLPNNLLLPVFDHGYKAQYLVKYERPDSARLSFIFNAKSDKMPEVAFPLMKHAAQWSITEHSPGRDTVTYWLTDPDLIRADTLRIALTYPRTDQRQQITTGTDTLTLTKPKVRPAPRRKMTPKQAEADSIAREKARWIQLAMTPSGSVNIYSPLVIETPEPVTAIDNGMIRLELKEDSVYKPIQAPALVRDSTGNVRQYSLRYPWEFGKSYRLCIDSTAMTGVSGRPNATFSQEFTIKKREDYASLTLRLLPDTIQGFVEVLNSADSPVTRARVVNGVARFPYLAPADYYARFVTRPLPADSLTRDELKFHPGDYDSRTQPDDVYYYPKVLSLKRHDRSEQWDLNSTPVDRQKPEAIKKNKPQVKSTRGKNRDKKENEPSDDDDYFDVNSNPFEKKPDSRLRNR